MRDLEKHECVHCGELWRKGGMRCDICNDFWCPDWQDTFIISSLCKECVPILQDMCSSCYLKHPEYHCSNIKCEHHKDNVEKNWSLYITEYSG